MMIQLTKNWSISLPVFTPAQIDHIKLVAFIAMIADHANTAFALHNPWLMLSGRAAFPLFAIIWGINQARHSKIQQSSLNRLWVWALVSQPAYAFVTMQAGASFYQLNILFTFAVAGQTLCWLQTSKLKARIYSVCLVIIYLPFSLTSYFIAGLLLLWLSVWMFRREKTTNILTVGLIAFVVVGLNIHMSALFALSGLVFSMFVLSLIQGVSGEKRYLPATFFFLGYVGHLAFLGMAAYAMR